MFPATKSSTSSGGGGSNELYQVHTLPDRTKDEVSKLAEEVKEEENLLRKLVTILFQCHSFLQSLLM